MWSNVKWYKKDFVIRGYFTGSRLRGHEHEYLYDIYWEGKLFARGFSSKAKAEAWLGDFLKKANALRKEAYAKGLIA